MEESTQKKAWIQALGIISLVFISIFYYMKWETANQQLKELKKENAAAISSIETKARVINREFNQKFFTFENSKERYDNVKSLMTEQGYKSTFPSGNEVPTQTITMKSKIDQYVVYENHVSAKTVEYINTFNWMLQVQDRSSDQKVLTKTTLIYKGNEWKVDDFEIIENTQARSD
ncbi:hypothetical protein A8L34_28215 [Bacillus sp. FJAT-27264]|uniref:hypothetical protein n=1 Tax=Paenibacillus sp. (strain DSM 101736 / FJAT-27264) TaxID=1850362 RepID=UPI0008080E8F|nr:hypothetical protein [Bacillus sp. FJAT-27264]OBZ15934.1 hypothetical protein A8L34_28215 [Bacillus sp. FJAT-27264]